MLIRYKMALQMRRMNHLRKTTDGTWEVRIVVPADVREHIGKGNLTKRLGRVRQSEANRLAVPVVAAFQALIEQARQSEPVLSNDTAIRTTSFTHSMFGEIKILPPSWAKNQPLAQSVSLMALFDDYASERL